MCAPAITSFKINIIYLSPDCFKGGTDSQEDGVFEWINDVFGELYDVKRICDEKVITEGDWFGVTKAIIFGSTKEGFYNYAKLDEKTISAIRKYVNGGGIFIGIGGGSSIACKDVDYEKKGEFNFLDFLMLKSVQIAGGLEAQFNIKSCPKTNLEQESIDIKTVTGDVGFLIKVCPEKDLVSCNEFTSCVKATYKLNDTQEKHDIPAVVISKVNDGICALFGARLDKIYKQKVLENDESLIKNFLERIFEHMGIVSFKKLSINSNKEFLHAVLDENSTWFDDYLRNSQKTTNFLKYTLRNERDESNKNDLLVEFINNSNHEILYFPIIGSTQLLLETDSSLCSFVPDLVPVVSSIQTYGKGRSSNKWLSFDGCVSFSFTLTYQSMDGDRFYILQHIAAISMIISANNLFELLPDTRLRLKWPNDIFIEQNGNLIKVGGVLVSRVIVNDVTKYIIGCGLNAKSSIKSICSLSDLSSSTTFKYSFFLNSFFSSFKSLTSEFIQSGNADLIKFIYSTLSIHHNSRIKIHYSSDCVVLGNDLPSISTITPNYIDAVVVGIDSSGFLIAKDSMKQLYRLHPNNNTFDLTNSMIHEKIKHNVS